MKADFVVQVFARAPVPGRCKTRLIPAYGPAGAARWHRRLVERTLERALASQAQVELWCAPDLRHPFFRSLRARHGLVLHRQHGGDLGERMTRALNLSAPSHARPGLLIGTDCPSLTAERLHAARRELDSGVDCVLQAAEDGGFVLIGVRRTLPATALHAIRWSSGVELEQTVTRLKRSGLSVRVLEPLWDIDYPRDLRRARRAGLV